jgi:hypothetical protein
MESGKAVCRPSLRLRNIPVEDLGNPLRLPGGCRFEDVKIGSGVQYDVGNVPATAIVGMH